MSNRTRVLNAERLLQHGNKIGRKIALEIVESSLVAVDSYATTKKLVRIENDRKLIVDDLSYDLSRIRNVFIVGAGKATFPIAQALDEILANRIKKGIIIVKTGQKHHLKHVEVREAGHPIPDEAGLKGANEIMSVAREANEGDLVFCLISGGASALMPLPTEGISLEDKRAVTDLLLKCGAKIEEIHSVRRHLSDIKGGKLAKCIYPAEIINLIVVDEVAGLAWGPTVPDTTTFADAVSVLNRYDLLEKVPTSVKRHLLKADPAQETPKEEDFRRLGLRTHDITLANSGMLCEAAKKRAEELGFNCLILSSIMEGESREVGVALSAVAREIERYSRPLKPPCVVVIGGETTVTLVGEIGEGGRNQEFALASSLKIAGSKRIVILSIGTDGTDGPSEIAGAIVDGYTLERARKIGMDLYANLKRHNSSYVFRKLNDAIFTGATGTNVMDLRLLIVTTP